MPVTVTASQGGSTANGLLLRVKVLTGTAATQTGNTDSNSSSTPFTPDLSLITTVTGSYVYGALANGSPVTNGTAFTAAAGNTVNDSYADSTNAEQYGTCRTTAKTGTPGATTVGASLPLITGGIAFAEILPGAGGLSEDPSSPTAAVSTSGTSVSSSSFTPPDGALLVAMVSSDGGSGVTTMALSGGGLTWSPLAEANGSGNDYAGVWIAQVPPSNPFDPVITATQGGSTAAGIALRIYVLTQAAATQNGGTSNNQFLNATSFTQSVTTTQTGSRVYGASAVFGNNSATAAAATTVADNIADTVNNGRYVTFKATALTGTPGATTLGFTVATSSGPFAQAEILSAGTLTEDNSAPPPVSDTGNTFVSCANFSPPGGSLLVALVASDGGAAVTTMTVSGGGLTWTELARNNPSAGDYAGVWIAQVPAAGGSAPQPISPFMFPPLSKAFGPYPPFEVPQSYPPPPLQQALVVLPLPFRPYHPKYMELARWLHGDAAGALPPAAPPPALTRARLRPPALVQVRRKLPNLPPSQFNPPLPLSTPNKTRRAPFLRKEHSFSPVPPQFNPPLPPSALRQTRRIPLLRLGKPSSITPSLTVGAPSLPLTAPNKTRRAPFLRRGRAFSPVPSQFNPPIAPSAPNRTRRAPFLRRGATGPVAPAQVTFVNPPTTTSAPNRTRRAPFLRRGRASSPVPPQLNPPLPTPFSRPNLRSPLQLRKVKDLKAASQLVVHPEPVMGRMRKALPVTPRRSVRRVSGQPVPYAELTFSKRRRLQLPRFGKSSPITPSVVAATLPPLPTMFSRPVKKAPLLRRGRSFAPVPPQVVVAPPTLPTMFSRPPRKAPFLRRGKSFSPVPPPTDTPALTTFRRRSPGFLRRLIRRVLGPLPFVTPPAIVGGSVTAFDYLTQTTAAMNFSVSVGAYDSLATATVVAVDVSAQSVVATNTPAQTVQATDRIL